MSMKMTCYDVPARLLNPHDFKEVVYVLAVIGVVVLSGPTSGRTQPKREPRIR